MIGAVAIATVALVYPNWRATYEDMKGSEILNFPTVDISPQDILPSNEELDATIEICSSSAGGENDEIEKVRIDIVNTEEGETYIHGHLNFSDARDIINFIKLEYYNETHYRVLVWGYGVKYIKIGTIGETVPISKHHEYWGGLVEINGTICITTESPQKVAISINLSSNVSFVEFSDSLGVCVSDSSNCEVLVRKYYDPPQTSGMSIRGLPPLTNKTSFPLVEDSFPYARIVRIRNDYYVAGKLVGLLVILGDENMVLRHDNTTIGSFFGGPMAICIATYWDAIRPLRHLDVYVGGEYWGRIVFFEFWFFMNPLFWLGISPLFLILAVVLWNRRVRDRIRQSDTQVGYIESR